MDDIKKGEPWTAKRDAALFTLLYGCGLQIDEALRLNVSDLAGTKGGARSSRPLLAPPALALASVAGSRQDDVVFDNSRQPNFCFG